MHFLSIAVFHVAKIPGTVDCNHGALDIRKSTTAAVRVPGQRNSLIHCETFNISSVGKSCLKTDY